MNIETKQKNIFLQSEADAWYERNKEACAKQDFSKDPIATAVLEVNRIRQSKDSLRVLEVGCGEGLRLAWLTQHIAIEAYGIEPSGKAVAQAIQNGVKAIQGTADSLPYDDGFFDMVIFGFCLYLCDPQDLFRIAQEADRVLKSDAWLLIHDFQAAVPTRRPYHHKDGVYSHKMDFRKLFDWHPAYTCYDHRLGHHVTREFCDDPQEWVATSLLRKKLY